jgi:hypothetical protein
LGTLWAQQNAAASFSLRSETHDVWGDLLVIGDRNRLHPVDVVGRYPALAEAGDDIAHVLDIRFQSGARISDGVGESSDDVTVRGADVDFPSLVVLPFDGIERSSPGFCSIPTEKVFRDFIEDAPDLTARFPGGIGRGAFPAVAEDIEGEFVVVERFGYADEFGVTFEALFSLICASEQFEPYWNTNLTG